MNNYNSFYQHNRNYGCRLKEVTYKGYKTLIIENEKIRASILVDKGTDIIEILYKPLDMDFMWQSPIELYDYKVPHINKDLNSGKFLDFYEGGWQELLPNISMPSDYKGSSLGQHGEAALLPWRYEVIADSVKEIKIKLSVRMNRVPFLVTKYLTLKSNETCLEFEEIIRNEGREDIEFMWGHHPSIGKPFLNQNCVIDLPEDATGYTYHEDYSGNCILPLNEKFRWPKIKDINNLQINLSEIQSEVLKTAFNVYIENLKEGWYGITNLDKGIGFGLKWDIGIFKYLMIWYVYGGYFGFPFFGRTYNIALEPWSAVPGDLDEVIKLRKELKLSPFEELKTKYYCIIYKSKNRIRGFSEDNRVII
jgi:hypothetical protein